MLEHYDYIDETATIDYYQELLKRGYIIPSSKGVKHTLYIHDAIRKRLLLNRLKYV